MRSKTNERLSMPPKIPKDEWARVHEIAIQLVEATNLEDDFLYDSRVEALGRCLDDLETRYGSQSRISATRADYAEEPEREGLYRVALRMAREEGDLENEALILESLVEIENERKAAQPGATDNPDDAQRLREGY